MVNSVIKAVDNIAEKAGYWIPSIIFITAFMSWLVKFIAPISQYGLAGDIAAGIVLSSIIMSATALLLMGWRYFNPLLNTQLTSPELAHQNSETSLSFVRTVLRLRFSGEIETPQSLYMENILDWFVYWSPSVNITDDKNNEIFFQPPSWVIFVNFKKPSHHHQISVSFTGDRPKLWEVKRSFTTSAVITITGPMLACELEMINVLHHSPPDQN